MKSIIKRILLYKRLRKFASRGEDVWIGSKSIIQGNIYVGSHIRIGAEAHLVSTNAGLYIHDYVVIGPEVSIYTGDHAIDIIGKHIIEITDADKRNNESKSKIYDMDVTIESGCWIGTRAIILKGVTIGRGSIVGAGAIVTKDVPPYSVYVGVPQNHIFRRFSDSDIKKHEDLLRARGITIK